MRLRDVSFWAALPAVLAAFGCDPRLPAGKGGVLAHLDGGLGGAGGGGGLAVVVEPDAPLSSVPRVLRLHASMGGFTFDPGRMALVKGSVGPRQLQEIATGNASATLASRILPALSWAESEGEALAPEAPLEAGELYTLVLGDLPWAVELTAAAADPVPLLPRAWPPAGGSGTAAFAVWCGAPGDVVPSVDVAAVPAPAGLAGRITTGAVPGAGPGSRCLRFEADAATGGGPVGAAVPPPLVSAPSDPASAARLDPRPLVVDGPVAPVPPLSCTPDEASFGPGCVLVADDRLYGRSTGAPLLWAVAGAGTDAAFVTGPGDPFTLTGLPPASAITLDVAAVDAAGRVARTTFAATTLPPRPHVVLNEVLAWPLGPQPAQEWVEIVNDGPATANLDGYVLVVGSGTTPLPAATLAPGAFALVVNGDYSPAGGPDDAPAPGAVILTVPHLGKQGLSNSGVALTLLDGDGKAVSRFPAKPKPSKGSSVARRTPSAPDALPASFAVATPSPGRINAW